MASGNVAAVEMRIDQCGAAIITRPESVEGSGIGEDNAQVAADEQAIAIYNKNVAKIDVTELMSIFVDGARFDYVLSRVKLSSNPDEDAIYTPIKSTTFKK